MMEQYEVGRKITLTNYLGTVKGLKNGATGTVIGYAYDAYLVDFDDGFRGIPVYPRELELATAPDERAAGDVENEISTMEDKMQKQMVMCDGEQFEYDVVIPASELRPYVLGHIVSEASAKGTGLSRDLYILPREKTDKWVIFGSDGIVHDLEPNEPVYVRFVDTAEMENELIVLKRNIKEAVAKYSK